MSTYVSRDIVKSRDWGRIPDYVAERAVVIVTGTWEGAELFDRPLAYMVARELASRGFWPVVLTDEFILDIGRRLDRLVASRTPFITIGGRDSNVFSALVAQETRVDPYEDVGIVKWRGTVVGLAYGRDPFGTRNAVHMFLDRYLDKYVAIIKDRRGISIVQWPTYKQEAGSANLANIIT